MFAGLISSERPLADWCTPEALLAALAPYSLQAPRDVWIADRHLLVQVATRCGAQSARIFRHAGSGLAVAFWGRLDNRPALIAQLEAGRAALDDELIAMAWLKWGEHCPERLVGDFAFAVLSPETGTLFLTRDVMGVKPLFYRTDADGLAFASSAAAFKALQIGDLTPDRDWMARFLLEVSFSHDGTAYRELKKLPPAHCLTFTAGGRTSLRRYHHFEDDAPLERTRDARHLEAYQAAWREAVACRMPAHGPIGTENSGGLDSGSVTAELARQLGDDANRHRLYGFGFAFDEHEPQAIMAVAKHCRMANQFLSAGMEAEPPEGWAARELRIAGYPNEHANGTSHALFYEECRLHGIGTLFSGFGGDEGVTASGLSLRRELFGRRAWRALWDILPGALPARAARFGLSCWRGLQPLPGGFGKLKSQVDENRDMRLLRDDEMQRLNLYRECISAVSEPAQFATVNAYAINRLSAPFLATRLENCTLMASAYGVEYVWPLLDARLLQQWLSTPSVWKVGPHGTTRYLHRRAVEPAGPPEMVWIRSKDMGNASATAYWDSHDNRPLFERMRALADGPPPGGLDEIVDWRRLSSLAETGLREERRGWRHAYVLEMAVANLEMLCAWLRARNP